MNEAVQLVLFVTLAPISMIFFSKFSLATGFSLCCSLAVQRLVSTSALLSALLLLQHKAAVQSALAKPAKASLPAVLSSLGVSEKFVFPFVTVCYFAGACLAGVATLVRLAVAPGNASPYLPACAALAASALPLATMLPALYVVAQRCTAFLDSALHPGSKNARKQPSLAHRLSSAQALVLDKAILESSEALALLEALNKAKIHTYIVDNEDGPSTEATVRESGVTASNNTTSAPLIAKLRTVLDARFEAQHPCEGVYVLLGECWRSIVSGVRTADDMEQLLLLLSMDYGFEVACISSDHRFERYLGSAACVLVPCRDGLRDAAALSAAASSLLLSGDSVTHFLVHLAQMRRWLDNAWKVVGYSLSVSILLAAPALVCLSLGLPLLLSVENVIVLAAAMLSGAVALAVERPEADVVDLSHDSIVAGLPWNGEMKEGVLTGRLVSYAVQCALLCSSGCLFATFQVLQDTGCASLLAALSGACPLHHPALQVAASDEYEDVVDVERGSERLQGVQLGWNGSILDAARSMHFCLSLAMAGWLLLVHRTRRAPLINALLHPGHLWQRPSLTLLPVAGLFAASISIATQKSVSGLLGLVPVVPLYTLYALPFIVFMVVDSEMRKFALGKYRSFPPSSILQQAMR